MNVIFKGYGNTLVAVLIASGILGAALDIGDAKLSAYSRFAASEFNRED